MTNNSPDDQLDSARLERLMEDVSRLPREVTPSRDAWPDIRQRIEAQRVRPITAAPPAPRRRIPRWWIGVAATLVATVGTMLTVARRAKSVEAQRLARDSAQVVYPFKISAPVEPTPVSPISDNVAIANPRLAAVIEQYQQATRELEAEVATRTAGMSPATREVVRRSLATIDTAIADLRTALGTNPRDAAAGQAISLVYERKLEFLKRVRSLPGTGM